MSLEADTKEVLVNRIHKYQTKVLGYVMRREKTMVTYKLKPQRKKQEMPIFANFWLLPRVA